MGVKFSERGGRLVVAVDGDVDHHSSDGIRVAVDREIARRGKNSVEFDLTGVSFMDSSGVGLILGRYKTAREYGGDVYITGANGHVARVIEISGLAKVVNVVPNVPVKEGAI